MPAGAHRDPLAFAPGALAVGPGLAVPGCFVVASFAGAVDGTGGVGLAHALPYAAEGSACCLFSAATDWRAAADARADGG